MSETIRMSALESLQMDWQKESARNNKRFFCFLIVPGTWFFGGFGIKTIIDTPDSEFVFWHLIGTMLVVLLWIMIMPQVDKILKTSLTPPIPGRSFTVSNFPDWLSNNDYQVSRARDETLRMVERRIYLSEDHEKAFEAIIKAAYQAISSGNFSSELRQDLVQRILIAEDAYAKDISIAHSGTQSTHTGS